MGQVGVAVEKCKDLTRAISTVESLIEFHSSNKGTPRIRVRREVGETMRDHTDRMATNHPNRLPRRKQGPASPLEKEKGPLKCFLCEGPHMAKECLTMAKLATLIKADEEQEETRLGSLWILSSIQKKKPKTKGMM